MERKTLSFIGFAKPQPPDLKMIRRLAPFFLVIWFALSAIAQTDTVALGKHIAEAAFKQVGATVSYDPGYTRIPYPGGDVPMERGVCTDVVIRALRANGYDLQKLVHEDLVKNFKQYPHLWNLPGPDTNIDHRRVPNLQTFFTRHGMQLPVPKTGADVDPGDFIVWRLPVSKLLHIGVVSTRFTPDHTRPLMIHNIGHGAQEEDVLFAFDIIAHYRWSAGVSSIR